MCPSHWLKIFVLCMFHFSVVAVCFSLCKEHIVLFHMVHCFLCFVFSCLCSYIKSAPYVFHMFVCTLFPSSAFLIFIKSANNCFSRFKTCFVSVFAAALVLAILLEPTHLYVFLFNLLNSLVSFFVFLFSFLFIFFSLCLFLIFSFSLVSVSSLLFS